MSVYGELSRYTLYFNRYVRIVKYWCKIIDSNNIIVNNLNSTLLDDMTRGKCNWASRVKQLLCNAGFTHVWDNPISINFKHFPVAYKNAIINDFKNSWLLS